MKRTLGNVLTICIYGIIAGLLVWIVYRNGVYPGGADTMCHVYKGDILYKEILKGNFYPMMDPMWYNGVEMMRYWAPLPVYVLALCQALAGGNPFLGYLLFVGGVFFFGALVWLRIGNRHDRFALGAFFGALWFFMPNNLYALFVEGNLPRSLCMIFLPWLFEQVFLYLQEKRWTNLLGITLCFLPITLCHLGYAGMILLGFLIYSVVYFIRYRGLRKCLHVLVAMALGILILGIWVYPSLQGGITSTDSSQVMKTFFQPAAISLNPFYRVKYDPSAAFYFGLSAFIVALVGMFVGKRKSGSYFGGAIVIFVCTTTALYPVLSALPGSQYLWMLRFISIALCMILFGLVLWDTLKKKWLHFFCVLLVLDVLPSLSLLYGEMSKRTVEERFDEIQGYTLIADAQEITTQRLALMDLSALEATGAYLISDYGKAVPATFGAGWQSANTASNIVLLNEAMETGRYLYLFDRCKELGNDSVLIRRNNLKQGFKDVEKVQAAAKRVGYKLAEENEGYQMYHLDTYEQFGVITQYKAIAIGDATSSVTMDYPCMKQGDSPNLNDYSFEELSKYKLVFLNRFTYANKAQAEELVIQLSEAGVRVVIEADGIPIDEHTGIQSFLEVVCQPIVFSNGYPLLDTIDGILDCDLFPVGYSNWKASYLNGLDESWGKLHELEEELTFYGTVKNDNIVMIGLNLSYFYSLTEDKGVGKLLSHAMTISTEDLPDRKLVPIEVVNEADSITVRSEYDNVNTTLAYHDIFDANENMYHENNLTYVNKGETVITFHYPYLREGMGLSIGALAATVLFLVYVKALWRRRNIKKVEITGVVRPVKGVSPCFEVEIPQEVKYTVSEVIWYGAGKKEMGADTVYSKGKYHVDVILTANDEEHFDKELKSTVNGLRADRMEFLETDKVVLVGMTYEAIAPFVFLQQPTDTEGIQGKPATVKWMISKVPKVGYLQMQESGNWIICDTVAREAEWELSAQIPYDYANQGRYRIVYIEADGRSQYSDEFTVSWKANPGTSSSESESEDMLRNVESAGEVPRAVEMEETQSTVLQDVAKGDEI